jgi:hypothetical protein
MDIIRFEGMDCLKPTIEQAKMCGMLEEQKLIEVDTTKTSNRFYFMAITIGLFVAGGINKFLYNSKGLVL